MKAFFPLIALSLILLTACGGGSSLTLTQANYDKLHDDMSPAEVQTILGPPSSSNTQPIPIVGGSQTTYIYQNDKSNVTLVFKNDKLKEKNSNFNQ
jgi:hypothetical protein